jgi:hypothetical protein
MGTLLLIRSELSIEIGRSSAWGLEPMTLWAGCSVFFRLCLLCSAVANNAINLSCSGSLLRRGEFAVNTLCDQVMASGQLQDVLALMATVRGRPCRRQWIIPT